jgi:hypothetical protein
MCISKPGQNPGFEMHMSTARPAKPRNHIIDRILVNMDHLVWVRLCAHPGGRLLQDQDTLASFYGPAAASATPTDKAVILSEAVCSALGVAEAPPLFTRVRKLDGSFMYAAMSYSSATDLILSMTNSQTVTNGDGDDLLAPKEYPQLWVKLPDVQGPTATAAAAAPTAGAALPAPSGSSNGQTSTAAASGNAQPQRKRKAAAMEANASYVGSASAFTLCLQASAQDDALEGCFFLLHVHCI